MLLLAQLILLIWIRPQEGAVVISQPPQNQTVCEGDNVTVTCGFLDSDHTPNWIIGNTTFGSRDIMNSNRLHAPDVNNTNDTVLIILSITASMNGTRTQCEIPARTVVFSSVGVLTVMGPPLVSNLLVTEITLNSFSITWDAFSHDACGVLMHSIRLFNGMYLVTENITTDNSITFTGLNTTSLYAVSVSATNDAGQGPTVNVSVTTLTPAVPFPPRLLEVNKIFMNYEATVWVTWNSPLLTSNMTAVEEYNVALYDKDRQLVFTRPQPHTTFNLSDFDVKLNTREKYMISVSAISSIGRGPAAMDTFELQWLQSAMISLSPDNKSIIVTCVVTEASPQAKCLVTINCTKCREDPFTAKSFMASIQLAVMAAQEYVITVQAVRVDTNEHLEEYIVTKNIQVPKSKGDSDNSALSTDDDDGDDDGDDAVWIYVVIAIAVLVVAVIGILLISVVSCYIIRKRKMRSVGFGEEKIKGSMIGYTRQGQSSTPTSVTEKDQVDYQLKNGLDRKTSTSSEETINSPSKEATSHPPSSQSGSPAYLNYSQVDKVKSKEATSQPPSSQSDSPVSLKQENYSQVDKVKKHNKTNYVELGPFDSKQPVVIPMGAPEVDYTEVIIQSKQENSS